MTRPLKGALFPVALALALPALFLGQRAKQRAPGEWINDWSLKEARAGACTAVLKDGRLLTTGGQSQSAPLNSAEFLGGLTDFADARSMNVARSEHLCATLPDGRVLVAGGRVAGDAATNAAEIYDVANDTWTTIGSMREGRAAATLTSLPDGRLLIAGGEASGVALPSMEVFDPATGTFTLVSGAMSSPRKGHAASRLRDGRVLIVGGSDGQTVLNTADLFDPTAGSLRAAGAMSTAREGLSATLLDNGQVLIAGGSNGKAELASSELFDTAAMAFVPGPSMHSARHGHQAFLMPNNNTVILVGGESAGEPLSSTEQFIWWTNGYAGEFRKLGDISTARSKITGAATTKGTLAIAGGMASSGVSSTSRDTVGTATVSTDKQDYHPGESVYITGNGFGSNDTVTVKITVQRSGETAYSDLTTVSIPANSSGAFSYTWVYNVVNADLGATFHVIATGAPSGVTAETTFTDSRNLTLTFAGSGTGSVTITVNMGTVNAPLSCGGTGTNATSQTVTSTCSPNITTSDNDATVTFSATAGATSTFAGWSGATNVSSSTCLGTTNPCSAVLGGGPTLTVTFNANATTTTSLSSTANPSTYGNSVTFNATISPAGACGTVAFKDGGATFATVTVSSGTASTSIATLSATGSPHSITAVYTPGACAFTGSTSSAVNQVVSPKTITGSFTANDKVYDGTTAATIATRSLTGVLFSDDVSLTGGTATFATKNVGSQTVTGTGFSLTGAKAGNYTLASGPITTTAAITTRALTITATGVNKVYDGATSATVTLSDDRAAGDTLTTAYTTAAFTGKNIGTGKTINVSGISVSGADAGNYTFNNTATTTANITTRAITVTAATDTKVYDQMTSSAATPTVAVGSIASGDASAFTQSFADKNAGTGKTLTPAGSVNDGNSGANYVVTFANATNGVITQRPLAVSATAANKVYDGTNSATVTISDNRFSGDVITVAYTSALFSDKNVAAGKTVTVSGISLTGADAANYAPNTTASATADITPRGLTISAAGVDKVYDGAATATVTLSDNRVAGDALTTAYGSAVFPDKNVGNGKSISVTAISLTGADAGNYTFNATASTSANITKRPITVTAATDSKVYDATTSSTGTPAVTSGSLASGDTAAFIQVFDNKNAGSGKTLTPSGPVNDTNGGANYTVTFATVNTGTITQKPLAVTATATSRVYDGTTAATATLSDNRIAGDVITVNYTTATFADKTVGNGKTVTVSGISLSNTDAGNYAPNTSTTATANITALAITGNITVSDKVYDGNNTAIIATRTLTGAVSGDVVAYTGGTATFADKNVGPGKTVTASGLSLTGADAGNYTVNTSATATATITARPLTVTATGVNKVYDGNANATVTLSDNRVSGDTISAAYTAASFDNKNVGTGKPVSVSGISISGTDAGNYALASTAANATANITARALTISATGVDRVYDGTTAATVTLSDNRLGSDVFTTTYTPATFNTKHAGSGKPISVTGISISGADAANYTFNSTASATATVTQRPITVTAVTDSKVYDANANSSLVPTVSTGTIASGDTAAFIQAFDNKNAATGKTLTPSGTVSDGNTGANYAVTFAAANTGAITPRPLLVSATATSKPYDGNTAASVSLTDNRIAGDVFAANYTSASFADKNVGTGKTVTVSGISLSGAGAGNYAPNTTATATANITALAIIGSITASDKVYDGNNTATIATRTLSGVISGDSVSYIGGTATFGDKNVGPGKTVTGTGLSLSGGDAGNYTVNGTATTTASITARSITVTATGVNKVYDGNATAAVTLSDNRVSGDTLSTTYASAAFADKNVGNGKSVSAVGIAISGADAGNYTLTATTAATSANITARALTISATGVDRVYDGTTAATVTLSDNRLGSDVFTTTYAPATFNTKHAGSGKPISVTGISISGGDAANYTFNTSANATANITPRPITVTAVTDSKVYDGNASSSLVPTVSAGTIASGDTAAFIQAFDNKNVATGKTLTPSGSVSDGNTGANYAVTFAPVNTGAITPRPLLVSATATGKPYDGNTAASVGLTDNRIASDVFTAGYTTATFANKNVGTGKAVTVSGISLSGTDAGNYAPNTTAATTASITALAITGSITVSGKVYDGTATATILTRTLSGVIGTDDVAYTGGAATFADKNVGLGKTVTGTGLGLGGTDATNYTVNSTASTTASITARPIAVTATGINKVYDGSTAATVNLSDDRVAADTLSTAYASAAFADKNVGNGKPVSVSGISISGTDAGNYALTGTTAATSANITARALTISATGVDRVYDGTTAATVTLSDNRLGSDVFTTTYAPATFNTKHAGPGKPVSVTGISISGGDAANYTFNTSASATANITPRPITVTAVTDSRVYNGTASSSGVPTIPPGGIAAGDSPAFTQAFDNKHVGTAKTLTPAGSVSDGNTGANYTVTFVAVNTGTITQLTLLVSATAASKVYDGNTSAVATLTDNRIASDLFTISYITATFANKNVGTGKAVTVSGISLTGTDANNYSPNATAATTANITALAITGNITASGKVYDGTATATILTRTLSGVIGTDDVAYTGGAATFADKNIGSGKTVTGTGLGLGGTDATNYTVNSMATTTASITARPIAVTATGINKVYDGNATAAVTLSDNRVSGDTLSTAYASAAFADKNVGNGKSVNVSGIAISGADAGNYTLTATTASTSANITKRVLAISAAGTDKVYDGTTAAVATLSDNRVSGDSLSVTYGSANFVDPNVGTGKTINVTGIAISGPDSGNYSYSTTVTTTANITPRPTTISLTSSLDLTVTPVKVVLKATVGSGGPVPIGTVTFTDSVAGVLGNAALSGAGEATFNTASLAVGQHVITATYLPNGNFIGMTSGTNTAPAASITGPATGSINPVNIAFNFTATFTDTTGNSPTATAAWSFDGVSSVMGSVAQTGSSGTVTKSHAFNTAGVYNVVLTVNDNLGGISIANVNITDGLGALVVAYDPNGGFVTGGGWIISPVVPTLPYMSTSAKANFGFVSKYQKGANVPSGDTEFQFKEGNLSFKSNTYEWLVIAGSLAQYKGVGTINGSGSYGFLLTATDGQVNGGGNVDKFRIKIWDKANGDTVVYDNQAGAGDDTDAGTALGGGSIVIHTK